MDIKVFQPASCNSTAIRQYFALEEQLMKITIMQKRYFNQKMANFITGVFVGNIKHFQFQNILIGNSIDPPHLNNVKPQHLAHLILIINSLSNNLQKVFFKTTAEKYEDIRDLKKKKIQIKIQNIKYKNENKRIIIQFKKTQTKQDQI
ncbi:hypothetical protein ABPG74_016834 [Tetrahymena malaccensis]